MNQPIISHTTLSSTANQLFLVDVLYGLNQSQKSIPCKWFYDEIGSALFESITQTPEYYPTRAETKLLQIAADELAAFVANLALMIEPGSGASVKTRVLLDALPHLKTYVPMDISATFLNEIANQLAKDYPALQIQPTVGDFTKRLPLPSLSDPELPQESATLIFFPGSTIGNFSPDEANQLLKRFHTLAGEQGWLLIGVDSTQDVGQLLAAYNDAAGITAQFNKNLLARANKELHANFSLDDFAHEAIFNHVEGRVEMHLRSLKAQHVTVSNTVFSFSEGETIFTESCYKYTHAKFLALADACGWKLVNNWQDFTSSAFTLFLLKVAY